MPLKPVVFLAFANDRSDYSRYLRNLPFEQNGIMEALLRAEKSGLCELIVRSNASLEQIIGVFQDSRYKDRIAIFHYGGHADGYQLLLESAKGEAVVARGEGLVSFFGKQNTLKLIFLNGCSTQQQAQDLVEAGVPMVIGTANSIQDDIATQLSIYFYRALGNGANLGRAWEEAIDQIKIQHNLAEAEKLYRLRKNESPPDFLPWKLYLREGAEAIQDWNLPDAVEQPLFGLPPIPRNYALPETPFLFLKPYERQHAEVFFGRSYYVRDLYNKIIDVKASSVILFYGQSGVGKSSLLDAGINPRLENSHLFIYLRRNQEKGLLGTFTDSLEDLASQSRRALPQSEDWEIKKQEFEELKTQIQQMAALKKLDLSQTLLALDQDFQQKFSQKPFQIVHELPEDTPQYHWLRLWKEIENQHQKPLIIILDQAEECYTRPNPQLKNEVVELVDALKNIFGIPQFAPAGRFILSYRKEFHAEIEERFRDRAVSRTKIFLEVLDRQDILDIFKGLTQTPLLQSHYGLQVEDKLPTIIADDLLEDKDSPVAPVLQILLTKMWDKVKSDAKPYFSVELYQGLKKDGFLLDDFFRQQMETLRKINREAEESGLVLDLLYFHTTDLGTANSRSLKDILERYPNRKDYVEALVQELKELYLLIETDYQRTNLTHDTIAPLVRMQFKTSERAGQRATRILESKAVEFRQNPKSVLDIIDLELTEKGLVGMRSLNELEQKLLKASRDYKTYLENIKAQQFRMAMAAVSAIIVIALFSLYQWYKSDSYSNKAIMKELIILSHTNESFGLPTNNINYAKEAYNISKKNSTQDRIDACRNYQKVAEQYRKDYAQELPLVHKEIDMSPRYGNIAPQQQVNQQLFIFDKGGKVRDLEKPNYENTYIPDDQSESSFDIVKLSPNQRFLVSFAQNNYFRIDDLQDDYPTLFLPDTVRVKDFVFGDSTQILALDSTNRLWAMEWTNGNAKILHRFNPHREIRILATKQDGFLIAKNNLLLAVSKTYSWDRLRFDTLYQWHSPLCWDKTSIDFMPILSQDLKKMLVAKPNGKNIQLSLIDLTTQTEYWLTSFANTTGYLEAQVALSPDGNYFAHLEESAKTRLYEIVDRGGNFRLKKLFTKQFGNRRDVKGIYFCPSQEPYLAILVDGKVNIFDKNENWIQSYHEHLEVPFRNLPADLFIDNERDQITLHRPMYLMNDWLKKAQVPPLDIEIRNAYQLLTLEEKWAVPSLKAYVLMQITLSLSALFALINILPRAVALFQRGHFFKLVYYGIFSAAVIFNVIYSFIFNQTNSFRSEEGTVFSVVIALALIIIFDERRSIKTNVLTRRWTKLILGIAPEILLIIVSIYGIQTLNESIYTVSTVGFFLSAWVISVHWTSHYLRKKRWLAPLLWSIFPYWTLIFVIFFSFIDERSLLELFLVYLLCLLISFQEQLGIFYKFLRKRYAQFLKYLWWRKARKNYEKDISKRPS